MAELLFEIGCEEIPARMLPEAVAHLRGALEGALRGATLTFEGMISHGTPRRLMVAVTGLAERQQDTEVIKRGPAAASAFQPDGSPTQALQGFLRSCGAAVADLERQPTPKGDYMIFRQQLLGRAAREVLPPLLAEIVRAFPWPKSMRWGDGDLRFVRPLHTLLALLDGEVLPFSLPLDDLHHLATGRQALGHRFMSPGPHEVSGIADYLRTLTAAWVMGAVEDRMAHIRRRVTELAQEVGGVPMLDEGLLSETACLTEWPVPLLGRFDERFLEIPPEVLVTSMKYHQKYFALRGADGKLLPCFVAVANIEAPDPEVLVRGYQRVLRARLEDASFYWNEDRKVPFAQRREELRQVVFQAKLGTLYAKTERMAGLGERLAARVDPALAPLARETAALCKGDLVTGMVGEFPELQGIMGAYYAADALPAVRDAIREHYQPQGAKDSLPASPLGALVSLADKLDTLVGFFGVAMKPTGNKDPFALRRSALGIIRILLERKWSLPLAGIIRQAHGLYEPGLLTSSADTVVGELTDFLRERISNHFRGEGVDYDVVNAVLEHPSFAERVDLQEVAERIQAVQAFKQLAAYGDLVAMGKRIRNIVQDQGRVGRVDPDRMDTDEERSLHAVAQEVNRRVEGHLERGEFAAAMSVLSDCRDPLEGFFRAVMVMTDDLALRANRINLLRDVERALNQVAVVSALVAEGE